MVFIKAVFCKGEEHCKTQEELNAILKETPYFKLYTNRKQYYPNEFGDKMVQSKVTSHAKFVTKSGARLILNMQQHHAESEERWVGLGLLPANEESWFTIEQEVEWTDRVLDPRNYLELVLNLS